MLWKYKLCYSFVMEGEDETNSSVRTGQNFIEEDVICHENYFTIASYSEVSPSLSDDYSSDTIEVSISMVPPPPEQA